jgi:hypothetical protein
MAVDSIYDALAGRGAAHAVADQHQGALVAQPEPERILGVR